MLRILGFVLAFSFVNCSWAVEESEGGRDGNCEIKLAPDKYLTYDQKDIVLESARAAVRKRSRFWKKHQVFAAQIVNVHFVTPLMDPSLEPYALYIVKVGFTTLNPITGPDLKETLITVAYNGKHPAVIEDWTSFSNY